jgi:hypothetical protein
MKFLKKLTLLIVLIFSSCSAQEETNNSLEVKYIAQTRGSFLNITFRNDSLYLKSTERNKTLLLSKEQSKEIQEKVSKIKLSEIRNLEAPSSKRYSDGALSAKFSIKKGQQTFLSSDFDHINPPKELKPLYDLLNLYIKKKVEN